MSAGRDQPRGVVSTIVWRVVHLYAAGTWGLVLALTVLDIAKNGDLMRTANVAGHYEASFVLWILSLLIATVASSLRALWMEPQR